MCVCALIVTEKGSTRVGNRGIRSILAAQGVVLSAPAPAAPDVGDPVAPWLMWGQPLQGSKKGLFDSLCLFETSPISI